MAAEILKSDLKSPLMLLETAESNVELEVNKKTASTGMLYNDWTTTLCDNSIGTGAALFGRSVVNKVPKEGRWQACLTKINFRLTTSEAALPTSTLGLLGLRIADQELSSYSASLFSQGGESLKGYVDYLPSNIKQAMYQRALVLDYDTELPVIGTLTKNVVYTTYIPSVIPSFTRSKANWNTEILEPLLLKTTFASRKVIGLSDKVTLESGVNDGTLCNTYTQFCDFEPEYRNELVMRNFGNTGEDVSYFSYNFEQQIGPLVGTNFTKVKLASDVPAAINYLYIRPVAEVYGVPKYLHTPKIDLKLNNKPYIDGIPCLVMSYKAEITGGGASNLMVGAETSASTVSAENNKIQTFTWCERPQDRNGFSGGIAYGGIENPEFNFHYATATAADYEYVIVSLYYQELYMNGKSGKVSVGLST